MIYMGTVVIKWATQCLAWGSMLHTVEAIKQFVDKLNKHSRRQVLAAEHPCKKHKHMSSSTRFIVTIGQFEKMFETRYQVTLEKVT